MPAPSERALIRIAPHPQTGVTFEEGPPRDISYLRVSVTDRCNLRCRYCMPEDQDFLDLGQVLSFEEIVEVAGGLVERGVGKIRITGGEPLVRRELPSLVAMLKALPGEPEVVMTTNGMLLARHAKELRAAGLDRLNVSLDTLRPDRFERLARRPGLQDTLDGVEAALAAGFQRTKLNTVVMGGWNDDELTDLLAYCHERGIEQRFIEFMPMASNDYGLGAERVPVDDIKRSIAAAGELLPRRHGQGVPGPATEYTLSSTGQRVGIIAAISLPFCETCNRLRLTSTGVLRSCLFEGGEVDVRHLLGRDDTPEKLSEVLDFLRRIKPVVHEGQGHVQMNRVGG